MALGILTTEAKAGQPVRLTGQEHNPIQGKNSVLCNFLSTRAAQCGEVR